MRWAKIDRRIFSDEKFIELSPLSQLLFFHILVTVKAGPIPGLLGIGPRSLEEATQWEKWFGEESSEQFRQRFGELLKAGLIETDTYSLIWVPNAIKYNPPANANIVLGWSAYWDELPEGELKSKARAHLRTALQKQGEQWVKSFDESCPNRSINGSLNRLAAVAETVSQTVTQTVGQPISSSSSSSSISKEKLVQKESATVPEEKPKTFPPEKTKPKTSPQEKNQTPAPGKSNPAIQQAAAFVCRELSLAGKPLTDLILEVLVKEVSCSTESADTIAELMVTSWRTYRSMANPSFVYPPRQFFAEGVWKQPEVWRPHLTAAQKFDPVSYKPQNAISKNGHVLCANPVCKRDLGPRLESDDPSEQFVCSDACAAQLGIEVERGKI